MPKQLPQDQCAYKGNGSEQVIPKDRGKEDSEYVAIRGRAENRKMQKPKNGMIRKGQEQLR